MTICCTILTGLRPDLLARTIEGSSDACQRGGETTFAPDGSVRIPLTQGQFATVSAGDYQRISGHRWYAHWVPATQSFRAVRMTRERGGPRDSLEFMHRVLMGVTDSKLDVDHINHDTLDNRRDNLRVATRSANASNQRKVPGTSSRFKGVTWRIRERKWFAQITSNYKRRGLGYFDSEVAAAEAYDRAALEMHGEYANTNRMMGLL
jgi:hypothetical protein